MINPEDITFYDFHGFVVIKNVVPESLHNDVLKTLISLINKYRPDLSERLRPVNSWDHEMLHNTMMLFRQEDSLLFGLTYDTMFNSLALQQIYFHPALLGLASALLRESFHGLSVGSHVLRMDVPQDKRNVLNWHQDSSYFQPSQSGSNGLVCWIPLTDVTKENGTVIICDGSHKERRIAIPASYAGEGHSHQFTTPFDHVQKYRRVDVVAEKGDAVFFNMDLIHRSGTNSSQKVRFSALGRYHRILTEDYTPGKFFFKPSAPSEQKSSPSY